MVCAGAATIKQVSGKSTFASIRSSVTIGRLSSRWEQPYGNAVLPRTLYACPHGFDTARLWEFEDVIAELGVMIEQDVRVGAGKRQSLP